MAHKEQRPNVLLIMCDQMRGDCLGIDGHPDVKTPYLDTLAAHGMLFENAYSACPSCIPARATLLTGKTPAGTGRVGYRDGVDWEYDHMMAEEMRDGGYQTAVVGKMHVHPPRLGCGFEHMRLHDGYIGHYRKANLPYWMHQNVSDDYMRFLKNELGEFADVNGTGVENNSWITHPWVYEGRLHPTNWVVDESIRFLETRDRTRPFFLMTSFVRPHPPFDAPQAYFDLYRDADLREPAVGDWDDVEATERDGMIYDSIHGCRDAELRRQALAGYYACITHMDHQIGRLLTALENDETYNDTVIVFCSDHGDMLFDHGLFRKVLPYEGSARIPFIVHVGKNIEMAGGGRATGKSESLVELMDLMPTLLDLCGLEIPEGVEGSSLVGELSGASALDRAYVHGEHARDAEQSNQWIVTPHDKYLWFTQTGVEQYFDLDADPRETRNLIDDPACAERIAELCAALVSELEGREEGYVEDGKLVVGRKPVFVLEHPRGAHR
ncbi:arylsulfatase [uncultured Collinsella sp.]|uniref:arylsulfatase n=1 Tax=uncultured Collinsella sp. TaxID=165190 RepID=UPI0025E71395|nr:arylsulfatase [uncultured Collinsella sp.]